MDFRNNRDRVVLCWVIGMALILSPLIYFNIWLQSTGGLVLLIGLILILNNEGKRVVAAEVRYLRFMSIIFALPTAVAGYLYFGEDSLSIMLTAMAGYGLQPMLFRKFLLIRKGKGMMLYTGIYAVYCGAFIVVLSGIALFYFRLS